MPEAFDPAWVGLVITALISAITGASGASLISGIFATKRGVKGDELKREENGTNRFNAIFAAQDTLIKQLTGDVNALKLEVGNIRREVHLEVAYNRVLTELLDEHTIEVPPRSIAG
jgi:hypothetical protein